MRSKFNSPQRKKDKPVIDGFTFDSELEARYYVENIKGSPIVNRFVVHPRYELLPKTTKHSAVIYIADFEITYDEGTQEVIDVKGLATETALLKRKMFEHRYPNIPLLWMCYSKMDGGWIEYNELQKARARRKKEKKAKGAV